MDSILNILFDVKLFITVTVLMVLIYIYYQQQHVQRFPPGPRSYPLIGNLYYMIKNDTKLHQACLKLSRDIGPLIGFHWGSTRFIILNNMKSVKQAFLKQSDVFSGRPIFGQAIIEALGKLGYVPGIVGSEGVLWRNTRRFCLKMLHKLNIGTTPKSEEIMLNEIDRLCEQFKCFKSKPFSPQPLCDTATGNIISNFCFNSRVTESVPNFMSILKDFDKFFQARRNNIVNKFPILRYTPLGKQYYSLSKLQTEIDKIIKTQIDEHRQTFQPDTFRDMIDVYLDEESRQSGELRNISLIDIQRIIQDLFIAGVRTVSGTIQWAFVLFINYPDIQLKCQQEIDEFVEKTEHAGLKDRKKLPYLCATLNEIQRFSSIAPFTIPHRVTEDTTLMGYTIPKNTFVLANLHAVHRDPDVWEEPDKFLPSRWLDQDGKLKKHDNLIPFGMGPRRCLGDILASNEYFLFLANILKMYTLEPADDNLPSLEAPLCRVFLPRAFEMVAKPRQTNSK